jgi:putative transposase
MTTYRRNFVPGGSFFFTVNLAERRLRLLTENIGALRAAFRDIRTAHPFAIEAIVILPDHLHTIWSLPDDDCDFATRWRLIKSAFSRALPQGERISESRRHKGERGIWQRRYWEHTLRDERDVARRARRRASQGLHSLQSGEAWLGDARARLAAFVVPPHGQARRISGRLGGRREI